MKKYLTLQNALLVLFLADIVVHATNGNISAALGWLMAAFYLKVPYTSQIEGY